MRPTILLLASALILCAQKPDPADVLKMAAKPGSPEFLKALEANVDINFL